MKFIRLSLLTGALLVFGLIATQEASVATPAAAPGIQAVDSVNNSIQAPAPLELEKPRCYYCNSSSTGACKGADQCFGTRKSCGAKGCQGMSGSSSSCSTAANVKKC
ncbi:MAG: hypothetical protein H6707_17580 [Deltaproteobacteria bacterium]|nr:hypothetical protein [Deltaproteobacteria bacterium]